MRFLSKYQENWTQLVIASVLACLVFSIGALAQTGNNQPLDDEAVSALVDELKDGLSELVEDPQLAAITKKWDAREDLAGKTKAAILKLLFADVKSVIKDKETQDNIWSVWLNEDGQNTEPEPEPKPATKPAPTPPPVAAPAPVEGEASYFKIEDSKHNYAIVGCVNSKTSNADSYYSVMHALYTDSWKPTNNPNANWHFEPAGGGYYYITNAECGQALVAGDNADNSIYQQDPKGRDNAKWKLVPAPGNTFYIVDKKHGKAIVAGDTADFQIYHQDPGGRKNAMWKITLLGGHKDIPKEIKVN